MELHRDRKDSANTGCFSPLYSLVKFYYYYRVTMVVRDLGWVDKDLGCSTMLPVQ